MSGDTEAVWHARDPDAWPQLPEYLTYSVLRQLEKCPRQWALSNAAYPSIWTGRGYPRRLSLPSVAGTIVHGVIEVIARAFLRKQCASIDSPAAVQALREVGGFTNVLEASTERALHTYRENPRAAQSVDTVRRTLRSQFPELRKRVQALISVRPPIGSSGGHLGDAEQRNDRRSRRPLTKGAYSEVEVRATELRWKGTIDLLTLAQDGCEIVDFKSGSPSDDHALQVRIYSLLWSLDVEQNPDRILATTLAIAYTNGATKMVAPTGEELARLRAELEARSAAVQHQLHASAPAAKPSAENCSTCDVRHLCSDYWTTTAQAKIGASGSGPDIYDGEFELEAQLGPSNWEAKRRVVPVGFPASPVVLRYSEPKATLRRGDFVRVLDGKIWSTQDQPTVTTLNVGPFSELFIVARA